MTAQIKVWDGTNWQSPPPDFVRLAEAAPACDCPFGVLDCPVCARIKAEETEEGDGDDN